MALASFYVIWAIIIFVKLMQQIQLFTDSVTEFLMTPESDLLLKKKADNVNYPLQLIPLLVFIVKAIQCLFILVSGFANA